MALSWPARSTRTHTDEAITNSMRELARIPLAEIRPGDAIHLKTRIEASRLGEYGPGRRFFQVSLVRTGTTPWMLPWPDQGIQFTASQEGRALPLRSVHGEFYLVSIDTQGPTGLAFDALDGKDCDLIIQFTKPDLPKDAELIVAPNWPNPMAIKDQMVAAMLGPTFERISLWIGRVAMILIAGALLLTFWVPSRSS